MTTDQSLHDCIILSRLSEKYGKVMRVMLGDQEWFVLSGMYLPYFNVILFKSNVTGLDEIKQFSMKEESTFHLPSKTFNEMYSFDKPLGMLRKYLTDVANVFTKW